MKFYLKTLTPLHIGNGEELSSLDYVLLQNKFYRISQKQFLEFLVKQKIDVDKYSKWITETTNKIYELENGQSINKGNSRKDKNQQLSELRKNFNLWEFVKVNETKKLGEFKNYLNTLKSIPFKGEIKQQVRGFIKNGNNEPYIPGTSIKGSIRTALLYHYLSQHQNDIIKILKKIKCQKNLDQSKKECAREFVKELELKAFYCKYTIENTEKNDDEKFDILKFLVISDGRVISENCLSLENVNLYLIRKDKSGTCADVQKQTPTVEAINENALIEFDIDFNIDYLLSIKNNLNNQGWIEIKVGRSNEKQWIGIKEKVKNIFDLDIDHLNEENKEEYKKKVICSIINKINNFSQKQLEWDKQWLEKIKQKNSERKFSDVHLDFGFNKVKGNNLIHLGFGTGFIGITEFLFFLKNSELKELYKEVMEILFSIGNRPGAQSKKYKINPDEFPKSKRLVTRSNEIVPLGWAVITDTLNNNTTQTSESKIEPEPKKIEPQYFKGKLKQGTSGIHAKIVKSGKPNKIKLYIEGYDAKEYDLNGYSSEIKEGTIVSVKINQMNKKGEILQVGFDKLL